MRVLILNQCYAPEEVDRKVEAIHRLMGGKAVAEFVTGDGRQ
jgi:hypothetical protein